MIFKCGKPGKYSIGNMVVSKILESEQHFVKIRVNLCFVFLLLVVLVLEGILYNIYKKKKVPAYY